MWARREPLAHLLGYEVVRQDGIFISKGVQKGATRVAIAVTITDNTRLALARYTITFDASPLLQLPIKIIPAAISASK